jgi:hypothetical protein
MRVEKLVEELKYIKAYNGCCKGKESIGFCILYGSVPEAHETSLTKSLVSYLKSVEVCLGAFPKWMYAGQHVDWAQTHVSFRLQRFVG